MIAKFKTTTDICFMVLSIVTDGAVVNIANVVARKNLSCNANFTTVENSCKSVTNQEIRQKIFYFIL